MKYFISKHCQKRYLERVLNGNNTVNNLLTTIFNDLNNSNNITSKVSTEVPRFILYLKERYGNDKGYNILKKDYIVFIAVKRKGTYDLYDVVTCYIDNDSIDKFKHTILTNKDIYLKLATTK